MAKRTPALGIDYGWGLNEDPGTLPADQFRLQMDAAALKAFAQNIYATAGLVYGYFGGNVLVAGVPTRVSGGTLALAPSATHYIERTLGGAVAANTAGWTPARVPLAKVVTDGTAIVNVEDWRPADGGQAVSRTGDTIAGPLAIQGTSDTVQLSVQAAAGQTTGLQRWLSSAGAVLAEVTAAGALVAASLTGSNLTSGRVALVGTSGIVQDNANLTYASGQLRVADTTASTSTTTGCARLDGGVGIGGSVYAGGQAHVFGADANAGTSVFSNGAAGSFRLFGSRTAGADRWKWGANSTNEAGSNAGSDWELRSFADASVYIDTPILVSRASGGTISLGGTTNRPVALTSTASVALNCSGGIKLAADRYLQFDGGGVLVGATTGGSAFLDASGAAASAGDVVLNAKSGRATYVQIAGSSKFSVTNTAINVLPTTASTSTTSGALVCAGGVGIAGAAYIGGNLYLGTNSSGAGVLVMNAAAGNNRGWQVHTAGNLRWYLFGTADLETGSNAGTNLALVAYSDTAVGDTVFQVARAAGGAFTLSRPLALADVNLVLGTTTGTRIGTAAAQKLSFFGATPIAQPATVTATPTTRTASTSFSTTEKTMLQEAHDGFRTLVAAIRTLGLAA